MSTVTIDGKAVAIGTAEAFYLLRGWFKGETGLALLVTDGLRSMENQRRAWNARQAYLAGRGPFAPHAAYPNPQAPHIRGVALDLRDSGADAGVTRAGTFRSNLLRANAPRFGFQPVGFGFGEPWHYELTGRDPWAGGATVPPAQQTGDGTEPAGDPGGYNPFGIRWTKGLQKVARLYGYRGAIDGKFGGGSMAGFAQFLRINWGYIGNDTLGPVMWSAIARWLRARYSYVGNDIPGPMMRAALLRAESANYRALKP